MPLPNLFAALMGFAAASVSIWLSMVMVPSVWQPPESMRLGNISSRVWQLTDPASKQGMFAAYCTMLGQLLLLAIYRTIQALVGIVPLCFLYVPIHQWLESGWSYLSGATIGSLVSLFAVWSGLSSKQVSDAH